MAQRKPLVLDDGLKIQELQSGDFIDTGGNKITATFTTLTVIGEAVYADGNDSVDLAQANAAGTSRVVGLACEGVAAAASGQYAYAGPVTATTGEWDAITGETGGLTVDNCYFLSDAAAGNLLEEGNTAGITAGDLVVLIGTALSTTTMLVTIQPPILRG